MSPSEPKSQIFNTGLRALRRQRAKRRIEQGRGEGFLLTYTGQIAAEKITDINRRFEHAVIIGLPTFRRALLENLPGEKQPIQCHECDDWPEELPQEVDLVVSGLVLQSINDIPGLMRSARESLRPDGLFLSALLGGESLLGLRRACFSADQQNFEGVLPRVAPMIDLQQAAGLLGAGGLALPVVDKDVCSVTYKSLDTLIQDLRDLGETNNLSTMSGRFAGRFYLDDLMRFYPERDLSGKFICPFEIIWMTGWKPHSSQRKPLRPGSAKVHLADAVNRLKL